ncbi:unnamed protein product [Albugo candida]|uniref:Uncharacterized protein n=1 Tax=Albugo candida TaxID=65357 RepID=A0A024FTK4_9STRA|nr:unnamed protein product [Albugo candida]|eukprot:CCI10262.1 unnamed protein product [Albugo candida]
MQSLRGASILALALAVCQLHVSHGQLPQRQYRLDPINYIDENSLWHCYALFQSALLNEAGVKRLTVTGIETAMIDFTITASLRGLQRAKDYRSTGSATNTAYMTMNELKPLYPIPFTISESKHDKNPKRFVCLPQYGRNEDDCRKCLMQKSNSILGDFFVTISESMLSVYVMYTSKSGDEIANACRDTGVCGTSNTQQYQPIYPDEVCQVVHGARELPFSALLTGTAYDTLPAASYSCICYQVTMRHNQQRKFAQSEPYKNWYPHRLQHWSNNIIVHWMKVGADFADSTLLLVWYAKDVFVPNQRISDKRRYVKKVSVEDCYRYYTSKLDFSAFEKGMSLFTSDTGIDSEHDSNCFVAYHNYENSKSNACRKCIESTGSKSAKASAISYIFTIQSSTEKENTIRECITTRGTPACSKFQIFPRDVCDHVTKTNEMLLSEVSIPSIKSEYPNSVVFASFTDHNCLVCYVLVHSVFFISIEQKYVWMERNEGPRGCDCLTIERKSDAGQVDSFQAISFHDLEWHKSGRRNTESPTTESFKAIAKLIVPNKVHL